MEACWAHNPEVRGSKPRSAMFFFLTYFGDILFRFPIVRKYFFSVLIYQLEIFFFPLLKLEEQSSRSWKWSIGNLINLTQLVNVNKFTELRCKWNNSFLVLAIFFNRGAKLLKLSCHLRSTPLYRDSDEISLYNSEELLWNADSRVAQWKRAGLITQRSEDQNLALLWLFQCFDLTLL